MGIKKVLKAASQQDLAASVSLVQQQADGADLWKQHLEALPAEHSKRGKDPKRHEEQVLRGFLAQLASKEAGSKQLRQLVKRHARWRHGLAAERAARRQQPAPPPPDPRSAAIRALVERTRSHPKHRLSYAFPSWQKGWQRSSRLRSSSSSAAAAPAAAAGQAGKKAGACGKKAKAAAAGGEAGSSSQGGQLRLLGVDCEMCATEGQPNALLGVCVVDESRKPMLQTLVQPDGGDVVDFRTPLTGLTASDLEGVTLRREDVAAQLAALLGPDTVLVGHSLHKDLRALQLDHEPVIDTALLFSYQGLAHCTPSLADLAAAVLGRPIRQASGGVHDSREDAAAALALVTHELQAGPTAPLPPPVVKADKQDLRKLLVHAIPAGVPAADVAALFGGQGAAFEQLEGDPASGKALVVFRHPGDADEAFRQLAGAPGRDSVGRQTKRVALPGCGKQVSVRKMAAHNGVVFGRDARSDRGQVGKAAAARAGGAGGAAKRMQPAGAGGAAAPGGKKQRPGKAQRQAAKEAATAAAAAAGTPAAQPKAGEPQQAPAGKPKKRQKRQDA